MGEYARLEILRLHGVDIGENENCSLRRHPCSKCGKLFRAKTSAQQHLKDYHNLPAAGPESSLQSSPAQPTKDETQS